MFIGIVDGIVNSGRVARFAKSVVFFPRAGEVWAFDANRVVERIVLPKESCLFNRAQGSVVHVRVLDGRVGFRVNDSREVVIDSVSLPGAVRPYARLGRKGDIVAVHVSTQSRTERSSNDSVIARFE